MKYIPSFDVSDVALAPVNNFSQFFEWNGNPLAGEFGGNCIIKSQELLLRGLSDFDDAYFLREIKGSHRAVMFVLNGERYFCDPTFMMDTLVHIPSNATDFSTTAKCAGGELFGGVVDVDVSGDTLDTGWKVDTHLGMSNFRYQYNLSHSESAVMHSWQMDLKGPRCIVFYLRFLNVLDGYLYSVQYFLSSGKILITPTFTADFVSTVDLRGIELIAGFECSTEIDFADLERVFVEARDLYREFKLSVNAK